MPYCVFCYFRPCSELPPACLPNPCFCGIVSSFPSLVCFFFLIQLIAWCIFPVIRKLFLLAVALPGDSPPPNPQSLSV